MQNKTKFNQGILIHGINEPKETFRKRVESILAPLTSFCSNHPNAVSYKVYISQEDDVNTAGATAEGKGIDEDILRMLLRAISEVYVRLYASKSAKGIKDFETKQMYKDTF